MLFVVTLLIIWYRIYGHIQKQAIRTSKPHGELMMLSICEHWKTSSVPLKGSKNKTGKINEHSIVVDQILPKTCTLALPRSSIPSIYDLHLPNILPLTQFSHDRVV